jgi:hypothetical protein
MSGGDKALVAALAAGGAALGFLTPWAGVALVAAVILWLVAAQVTGDAAGMALDAARRLVRPGAAGRGAWLWRAALGGALAGTAARWALWGLAGGGGS